MISFRNHVVSLLAVLLALAVGVVLGGGPLAAVGDDLTADRPETVQDPADASQAEYADLLAASVAPAAYGDRLKGVPVSLLTMPDADRTAVDEVVAQIQGAGGSVAGRWEVQDALVTPSEKTLVDSLGSQLATQQAQDEVSAEATTYDRAGQLAGLAMATTGDEGEPVDQSSATIAESLSAGRLLSADGDVAARAPYLVVVLGPDTAVEDDPIYEDFLQGLASQAKGVVVTADGTDAVSGRLSRLRTASVADEVVTVDGVDSTAGAVTAVLALTRWPDTRGGRFGAVGDDGAVPLG